MTMRRVKYRVGGRFRSGYRHELCHVLALVFVEAGTLVVYRWWSRRRRRWINEVDYAAILDMGRRAVRGGHRLNPDTSDQLQLPIDDT